MRKFQTLKLSQFHKEKTCWTQNWWSSGIMSNFWEEFFYILATALKSYIKWLLYFFFFFFFLKKFEKVEKAGIISTKFLLRCTPPVMLGMYQKKVSVGYYCATEAKKFKKKQNKLENLPIKYSSFGTIQVLRHHVFDFFRPTHPPH